MIFWGYIALVCVFENGPKLLGLKTNGVAKALTGCLSIIPNGNRHVAQEHMLRCEFSPGLNVYSESPAADFSLRSANAGALRSP